ncbi:MAG: tetratricopeptide repeat protein [Candidatus Melainabacteria bacterium]|nr:tetratricopeptide repeat protein [Candidatus Melainabacteria bacterium]
MVEVYKRQDSRSGKDRRRAAILCLLLMGLPVAGTPSMIMPCQAARAASSGVKGEPTGLGLDARTLKLVNQGNWPAVVERLEGLTAKPTAVSRLNVWLAFAYLFLGKCDKLAKSAQTSASQPAGPEGKLVQDLVLVFSDTCQTKLDDAEKILALLPASTGEDPLVNLAKAVVAGKRGQAASAVTFCEKAVELAPGFGWAWRTIGYLQSRWLKDNVHAEDSFKKALKIEPNCPEVRDMLVDLYLVRNDFDRAIDVATGGIRSNAADAGNYYRLAQIYTQQWRLREALQQLNRGLAVKASDPRLHRVKSNILRCQGDLNEAIAEQKIAVELSENKVFDLIELANLNLLAGNVNRAADSLKEALKIEPGNKTAFQKLVQILEQERLYADLVKQYSQQIQISPKDASAHLGLARALKATGKLDEAAVQFKEAANLELANPQPHRELAAIYIGKKDFAGAAKEYTRALNVNPTSVEDLVALGFCYAENDDYLQAETAFVTAIALQQLTQLTGTSSKSQLVDVMRSLAVLFLTEGRYSEACNQFEAICSSPKAQPQDKFLLRQAKALRDRTSSSVGDLTADYEKLPDDQKIANRLELVDTLLRLNQSPLAETLILQIQEGKADGQRLSALSRLHLLKGNLSAAEDAASKATAVSNEEPARIAESYLVLAEIQLAKGDIAKASATAAHALELSPKSFAAYEVLGRIYLRKGEVGEAIDAAKKALEVNPYHTPSYMVIGDAEAVKGNFKKALASYKNASDLYPGWLPAHKSLLAMYRKLSLKDQASKEEEQIAQKEKQQ